MLTKNVRPQLSHTGCGHFELVFTKENFLTGPWLHDPYMGTYNYYSPNDGAKHTLIDVYTWYKWGTIDD